MTIKHTGRLLEAALSGAYVPGLEEPEPATEITPEPETVTEPTAVSSGAYALFVDVPLTVEGPAVRWVLDGDDDALDVATLGLTYQRMPEGAYVFYSGAASGRFPALGSRTAEGSGMRVFSQSDIDDGIIPAWLLGLIRNYAPTAATVALHAPEAAPRKD